MISGVVLAAGPARRIGAPKLFLNLKGKPILQWTLEAALSSKLDELICVVREFKEIEKKLPVEHARLRWVANENADEGQSTSVIAGLKAVSRESEAALFLVGDQPLATAELINGLINLFRKGASLIVAPTFHGQTRNPVLFRNDLFPEILRLKGDKGARGLIEKYREKAAFLEWTEESPFLDLDTWEDYEKLKNLPSPK